MARQNVYDYDGYEAWGVQEPPPVVGWYDPAKAATFDEGTRWDGHNYVSLSTTGRHDHEELVRTAGGRWVLHHWSQLQGSTDTYRYLTRTEARQWLLLNEYPSARIEELTGDEVAEEAATVGRPEVGPQVVVRMPEALRDRIDAAAGEAGVTRAEWMRSALTAALERGEGP